MIEGHLWFTCRRGKKHLHIDVPADTTVSDVQEHIREILMTKELPKLKRPINDERTEWADLDPNAVWKSLKITTKEAKAEKPFILAYVFEEDNDKVELAPMSQPKNFDHLKRKVPENPQTDFQGPAAV